MTNTDQRIADLSRRWRRSRASRAYESFDVAADVPLSIVFGSARPTHLVFVTKDTLLRRIHDDLHRFPRTWVIASRAGIPSAAHAWMLSSLAARFELQMQFVGDIAPFDIHVFLEYRRHFVSTKTAIRWAGIGAAWLRKCERFRRDGWTPVGLTPIERKHRDQLVKSVPSLPGVVGKEVWAVLESGAKITLEAASGLGAYRPGIHQAIIGSLQR